MGQDRGGVDKKDQSASASVSEEGDGHCGGGSGVEQKPYDDDGGDSGDETFRESEGFQYFGQPADDKQQTID